MGGQYMFKVGCWGNYRTSMNPEMAIAELHCVTSWMDSHWGTM
jgi:hypothetical protein